MTVELVQAALRDLKATRGELSDSLKRIEKAIAALEPPQTSPSNGNAKPTKTKKKKTRRTKAQVAKLKEDAVANAAALPTLSGTEIHQRMVGNGQAKDTVADLSIVKNAVLAMRKEAAEKPQAVNATANITYEAPSAHS